MSVFKYLKDSCRTFVCFFLMILIIDLVLISSIDLDKSILDILYLNVLLFSIIIVFFSIGFVKWINRYRNLERAIKSQENIDNFAPEGEELEQILIKEIIELKNREKLREIKGLEVELEEINDYITRWIHEIKIPLSVCELTADKIEEEGLSDLSSQLRQEIERMSFLVNQVLYISRASSCSHDIVMEEVNLGKIVKNVIKNNINSFLSKKIELVFMDIDFSICTDGKWAYYVIEQIINNACKYVDINGRVEIDGHEDDESITLAIRDNGMGIFPKDIGRIFDRGFTGDNGRRVGKSTGMGLYISRKVADKLNFEIEVSSQVSEYTEFRIIFYKMSDYLNVTKM